jgi:ferredoxin-NADP reductase/ferredoxin
MPSHPRSALERALRIPALSAGWRASLLALLEQERRNATTGNAGLAPASVPPPAWTGFRPLRVSRKIRESSGVISLALEPSDGRPLAMPLPGQFIVLRLKPAPDAPILMRSYSLSDNPSTERYRVSVKREPHSAAGAYIDERLQVGDLVEASATRGSFTLRPGDGPVVFLSAGVGATPVLAMLHVLSAASSPREVWWLYGARDRREHPFADETRTLLKALPHSRSYICYSAPDPEDRVGADFDARGRLSLHVLQEQGVPRNAEFYLCGPPAFMSDLTAGLADWGVAADRIHTEVFGSAPPKTPGIAAAPQRQPHLPSGPSGAGPMISFVRSGLNVRWGPKFESVLELAEACDIPVRWACRTGVCHTCETGLVLGTVSYRPEPSDAPADGNVLICCCQPHGDIVIDL